MRQGRKANGQTREASKMSNGRPKFSLPSPRSKKERSYCRELYLAGNSYHDISDMTQVPVSTLRNWCVRDGWKKSQPPMDIVVAAPAESEPVEMPDTLPERQEFFVERTSAAAVKLAAHISKLDGEQLVRSADKLHKAIQSARTSLKLDTDRPACVIQIGVLARSPAKEASKRLHSFVRPKAVE
jgi:hypothetical protein